jgi:hypothetical protein
VQSDGSYTEDHGETTFTVRVVYRRDPLPELEKVFDARDQTKGFRRGGLETPGIRDTIGSLRGRVVDWLRETLPELRTDPQALTVRHLRFHCQRDCSDVSEQVENDYLPLRSLADVTGEDVDPATVYASFAEVA